MLDIVLLQWPLILRKMAVVGQSIDGQGCSMDATDESAMDELHFDPKVSLRARTGQLYPARRLAPASGV